MKLPALACDCHVHVIGDEASYPMAPQRHYTPGPAGHDDLLAHMARLSLERAVLVQPSVYGFDNRCMLDSLKRMGGSGRGIAVLPETVDEDELAHLAGNGVTGIRINLESACNRDAGAMRDGLALWADRVADFGWHIQLYASFNVIEAALDSFRNLPVPIVLDHFAMIPAAAGLNEPGIRRLLRQLGEGKLYVKLSAAYRISARQDQHRVPGLAAALIDANPERVVWGSDWPHTSRDPGIAATQVSAYRPIGAQDLADELGAWLGTEALAHRVLVDNPGRLYRF
ncbi:amidohydrolase family protein [Pollutimonas bauzanensis]|uniref:Predicted metal-dependent hydrolase, TIM-barrel fold n=1 Tax=Pollutimonas bauzanensis TaxID=658167 RepID=A0A1M5X692_9BURK|nr:amidohydrolase family protein [Pollutimonas bauzanensis]SHH95321.1 Predicted metal-dependent hydrolase, TIM-barrel fold [Pollutimonas bauzanensis]